MNMTARTSGVYEASECEKERKRENFIKHH